MKADWDLRFLRLATEIASWSKDPSTKVGAVIPRLDKTIASVGFNGFPQGMIDDETLYQNREEKLKRVIHAEMNALLFAKESVCGYSIYVTHFPCLNCMKHIAQKGIRRIFVCDYAETHPFHEKQKSFNKRFKEDINFIKENYKDFYIKEIEVK